MEFPSDMEGVGMSDQGPAPEDDGMTEEQANEEAVEVGTSEEMGADAAAVAETDAEESAEVAASQEIGVAEASIEEGEAEESAEAAASQEIGDAEASVEEGEAEESAEAAASQEIAAANAQAEDATGRTEGRGSCTNCEGQSSSQGYFDFGMMSLGIEGGVSFANHHYNAGLGNGSNVDFSGVEGAIGLRLTWEKFFEDNWTAGVTGSLRYYLGKTSGSHGTITAFNLSYAAKNMQRYELAAKLGKWVGDFHPYVKLGAVVSDISIQVADSTFASSTKQWVWGGTVGGGVETQISKDLILGGSVEYDRYADIKNNLANSTGLGGSYTAKPSFLNAMITLSCKLDKFF